MRRSSRDPAALLDAGIVLLPQSRALPALSLLDEQGEAQALDRLTGRWTLLFFGYTFCPDICPTTLAELRQLRGRLPAELLERYQVTMVSVDPQRDTPEQLRQYLGFYNAGYHGLTGELADIQKLAAAVSIPFIPGDTRQERYTVGSQRQPGDHRPGRPPARLHPRAAERRQAGRAAAGAAPPGVGRSTAAAFAAAAGAPVEIAARGLTLRHDCGAFPARQTTQGHPEGWPCVVRGRRTAAASAAAGGFQHGLLDGALAALLGAGG